MASTKVVKLEQTLVDVTWLATDIKVRLDGSQHRGGVTLGDFSGRSIPSLVSLLFFLKSKKRVTSPYGDFLLSIEL